MNIRTKRKTNPLRYRCYEEALVDLQDADLLLFRKRGAIALAGRGVHSHAAMVGWWDDAPFCLEVRELRGGRAVTLLSQVERRPGRIDVYRANRDERWPEFDRERTVNLMQKFCGCSYGYRDVFRVALVHVPFVRLLVRPALHDAAESGGSPFCSEACVTASRVGGGVDPVPHLADHFTEPADLARSPFYAYAFTLLP